MHGKAVAWGLGMWGGTWRSHISMWINQKNNCGGRQTTQPKVPGRGKKASKLLAVKTYENCGGRNSQPHRRVHWRDPQGPRTYTKPPTQESAPEGLNLLVGSRGSGWKQGESWPSSIVPSWPLSHIQCHSAAKWVAPPWQIPKAPPLTTTGAPRQRNMAQMKEQIKTPEKDLSDEVIANP